MSAEECIAKVGSGMDCIKVHDMNFEVYLSVKRTLV